LREARLASEWDVSRTPLREALRRAAEAGFVVLRPNQAPVVRELSGADVDAMYDLRALLETHALALAWDRIDAGILKRMARRATAARPDGSKDWRRRCLLFDRAFHQIWTRLSGNSWLEADLRRQHQFWSVFQSWVGRDEAALRKAYEEHIRILDAMRAGSKARAIDALRDHIQTSAEAVRKALPGHKRDEEHGRHT
jgi:DNA-binding GntR family transcriptional regulator